MPGPESPSDVLADALPYVGRFAPSPTGPLHLGTLTAAVASFLHARQSGGEWLVRIEDIDPPREVPGSADGILRTLERLNLGWDRNVLFQSSRLEAYAESAQRLLRMNAAFHCRCSRRQIRALTGGKRYPGTCRNRIVAAARSAVRLKVESGAIRFDDRLRGPIDHDITASDGDFVIVRRDGLPAYHLAVVVDDAFQGVTDIVRGGDLLDSTALHLCLQSRLGLPHPAYWHIPVITTEKGDKLSKSAGAKPADAYSPSEAAARTLELLGAGPPDDLRGASPSLLWQWALEHWRIEGLTNRHATLLPSEPEEI